MSKKQANITATILEKVARNSVKMAADSRCMYVLHQPKQPAGMKNFVNKSLLQEVNTAISVEQRLLMDMAVFFCEKYRQLEEVVLLVQRKLIDQINHIGEKAMLL